MAVLFVPTAPAGAADQAPLTVATFGTSLTARGGWQAPLATALRECRGAAVDVETVAKPGAGSDWGVEAVGEVARLRPDIALIEFAVNDAALNRLITVSNSVANMRRIVSDIRKRRPDVRIYVMTMNPVHGYRAWIRPWRASYETAHRRLAEELGIGVIDHSPGWQALGRDAVLAAIPDGAHPDPGVAASIIVPNIVARFERDGILSCKTGREAP